MRQKIIRLVEELSVNYSFYSSSKTEDQFICPICLQPFDTKDKSSKRYPTEAHIIPSALRGNLVTLVCKQCNSLVGSSIEAYETNRVKYINAFSGSQRNSWRVLIAPIDEGGKPKSERATAEAMFVNDKNRPTLRFKVMSKGSSPRAMDDIKALWAVPGRSISVATQVRGNWDRAKLTYLHGAYLFVFSQLGYEWVFDPCTQIIRDQIQNPEKQIIQFEPIPLDNAEPSFHDSEIPSCSWHMIVEPAETTGFLVVFSGLSHFDVPVGVWLPFPGNPYKEITEIHECYIKSLPIQPIYKNHLSKPQFIYLGVQLILKYLR